MKYKNLLLLMISLCYYSSILGQDVTTIVSKPGAFFEGITWLPDGRIYVVDFNSGEVFRIAKDGNVMLVADGIRGPLGGAYDNEGNYYFSEVVSGQVYRLSPAEELTVFASGLIGPAGLLVDELNDRIFVANFSGNSISTISMTDGSVQTFAQGSGLNGPDGVIFGPDSALLVANFNDNNIHQIDMMGNVSLFTTISESPNTGYLTAVRNADDPVRIFIAAFNGHAVYEIDENGNYELFAGSGSSGNQDGIGTEASFSQPNGIAMSPTGDSLLVTESSGSGLIRLITNLDVMTTTIQTTKVVSDLTISPNPVADAMQIEFAAINSGNFQIDLIDAQGKVLDTLYNNKVSSGLFQLRWERSESVDIQSGTHFLRIQNATGVQTHELIFVQ